MKKTIELTPLAEIGKGQAKITDRSLEVEIQGISGGMKVWLVGGEEAAKVGNIVEGRLLKAIDTTRHHGILVTQSGRQIMYGEYRESDKNDFSPEETALEFNNIRLKKITEKSYAKFSDEICYILSHRGVYRNFRKYGYYCAGESSDSSAVAFRLEDEEENPLERFKDMCMYKDGYVIVCVDKKTKKIKKL